MKHPVLAILVGFGLSAGTLAAQDSAPAATVAFPETIRYPAFLRPGEARFALGVSFIGMPAEIVQEAASIRWPLFGFTAKVGLPSHFVFNGEVSTEVLTNHLEAGGSYAFQLNPKLHADAGVGVAYFFGQLNQFGFKDKAHGWFIYPQASLGYDFGKLVLTGQVKAHVISSLHVQNGEAGIDNTQNFFDGWSWRVTLEQLFWKKTTVGLSFQMNRLKFYYPQWMLFPTYDRYFWMPEAMIRFSL